MKLIMGVLVAAWLTSGCASTVSSDDLGGLATPDVRTGLCNDATPPPCSPPPRCDRSREVRAGYRFAIQNGPIHGILLTVVTLV